MYRSSGLFYHSALQQLPGSAAADRGLNDILRYFMFLMPCAKIFSGLHWEALDNVFYTKPPITESFVDRLPAFRWRERDHVQTFV